MMMGGNQINHPVAASLRLQSSKRKLLLRTVHGTSTCVLFLIHFGRGMARVQRFFWSQVEPARTMEPPIYLFLTDPAWLPLKSTEETLRGARSFQTTKKRRAAPSFLSLSLSESL
jgi:hypothetical protein